MKKLNGYTRADYCFETLLIPTVSAIPEVIVTASAFDFPFRKRRKNQIFTGLKIYHRSEKEDVALVAFIKKAREKNAEIIYCSFGTILSERSNLFNKFFSDLITIASYSRDRYFIIKSGYLKKTDLPENVFATDVLPQLMVLQYSSIMISHGGLNTINECIHYEVPMLIYAVDGNSDRPGNAARVVFHQIGLRGDLRNVTTKVGFDRVSIFLKT